MTTCKQCREFEKCKDDAFINGAKFDPNESVKYCTGFEPITNADRIRAMRDEELCNWLFQRDCTNIAAFLEYGGMGVMDAVQLLDWLKQPAEGE